MDPKVFPQKTKISQKGGYQNGKPLWKPPPPLYSYFQCSHVILATNCVIMESYIMYGLFLDQLGGIMILTFSDLPPSLRLTMSKGSMLYVKMSMFPGSWLKFAAVLAATFTFLSILLLKLNTCLRYKSQTWEVKSVSKYLNKIGMQWECKAKTKSLISQNSLRLIMSLNFIGDISR